LRSVRQARLEHSEYGLVPASEGWFSVNVRDAAWMTSDAFGAACVFEGETGVICFRPLHPPIGATVHARSRLQPVALCARRSRCCLHPVSVSTVIAA
jgi:hypothetical protein